MKVLRIPAVLSPHQMNLLFESRQLIALSPTDRSKVTVVLAQILMQAAGLTVEELDDDEH